jgi:hypothetical protein
MNQKDELSVWTIFVRLVYCSHFLPLFVYIETSNTTHTRTRTRLRDMQANNLENLTIPGPEAVGPATPAAGMPIWLIAVRLSLCLCLCLCGGGFRNALCHCR